MNLVINQIDDKNLLNFSKSILENASAYLDNFELMVFYDIQALEEMYKINNFQALKFLKQSSSYDDSQLMVNYHFVSTYLCLGYLSLSQKYINRCIDIAVKMVAFDRLCYLLLSLGVLYIYTHRFSEAEKLNYGLLHESEKRKNEYLSYCVLSNIALSNLLQHNYQDCINCIYRIKKEYTNDLDIIIYKSICYYQLDEINEIRKNIKEWVLICRESKYHYEFLKGVKYLISDKELKAIESLEKCYNITIKNGEIDRGMLDLRVLEMLYLRNGNKKKVEKIKQLEREMYKISYASDILKDIHLELN